MKQRKTIFDHMNYGRVENLRNILKNRKPIKVRKIPPFFVRFFPNTEGIEVGLRVVIIRDPKQERFVVKAIELPVEFNFFKDYLDNASNLSELLSKDDIETAEVLMSNNNWLYRISVLITNPKTKTSRIIHPACLRLARKTS